MKDYASRKFIIAIYFGTAVFVLGWFGKLTGTEVVSCVTVLAGFYKLANVAEKVRGRTP